jgi:uncharacterized lipoprotein YmbA
MNRRHALMLFALLPLAGCGSSPPTRFFILRAVPPRTPARVAGSGPPVQVAPVTLPAALDRASLVTGGAGNRIEVSDRDRWVAPLDGLVRQTLSDDLRARLPAGQVLDPGTPAPAGGMRSVNLVVQHFMAESGGPVVLEGDWTVSLAGGNRHTPPVTHHERVQAAVTGQDGEAVAAAMSQALGELADRIAAGL